MSLGPTPLYDLIPPGRVAPRNPLDAHPYTFHAGDVVWFTLDRRAWQLGQVTSTDPTGSVDPVRISALFIFTPAAKPQLTRTHSSKSSGIKFWTGIFVQDNHLSTTSFTPLYGTAKPDEPYVRRVLRWARVLPDDDSAITEMVSSFMAELDWLTLDPRIQNTPIMVAFRPLVDRMDY
ncbi:hypothetical protein DFH11DRAFT_613099 [Phellopilus nigrolimitatus]|nr:hypothetical protein DFH11DRAFT_613099 [Phellopilus nigrolimitatus]